MRVHRSMSASTVTVGAGWGPPAAMDRAPFDHGVAHACLAAGEDVLQDRALPCGLVGKERGFQLADVLLYRHARIPPPRYSTAHSSRNRSSSVSPRRTSRALPSPTNTTAGRGTRL